jgi:hypothetical protein
VPYDPTRKGKYAGIPSWLPVPKYFLDELAPVLPASHWRVLLWLWRHTVGNDVLAARLSLGEIADKTRGAGVSRRVAAEALSWFSKAGLICRKSGWSDKANRKEKNLITMNFKCDPFVAASALRALVKQAKSRPRKCAPHLTVNSPSALELERQTHRKDKNFMQEQKQEQQISPFEENRNPKPPFKEKDTPLTPEQKTELIQRLESMKRRMTMGSR